MKAPLVIVAVAAFLVGAAWMRGQRSAATKSFGPPDSTEWVPFQVGDLRASAIETIGRIRLAADTRGTPPGTWKHLGVRRVEVIPLRNGADIFLVLNWIEKLDASSLSASLILSPHAVAENPRSAQDWIEVTYHGGSSGAPGRRIISTCEKGVERTVLEESLNLSRPRVQLSFRKGGLEVREDGRDVYKSPAGMVPYESGYLYLMLSSESNFPLREVHFEDLEVRVP